LVLRAWSAALMPTTARGDHASSAARMPWMELKKYSSLCEASNRLPLMKAAHAFSPPERRTGKTQAIWPSPNSLM
jgi:hypothetical protein